MYYKQLKKIALLLIIGGTIGTTSAQAVLKVGDNPYKISEKAALDIESVTKGFLPPRMTMAQRDAIVSPPVGLLVWCTNSNFLTDPVSGELCVSLGNGWAAFTMPTVPRLTTGKKADTNKPVRVSATSATIKGLLVSTATGTVPTETGIVWREIIGSDFATVPVLDGTGVATAPTYKTAGTLVTKADSEISVTIGTLTSTTSSTRPYYFRTYAKSPLGIGYGNPVIFNCAPPVISTPVVTNGTTLLPSFTGTLTVNAGTPTGAITEYGYCSGTTANPTTANNKVLLSDSAKIIQLNASLNSETFSSDIAVPLTLAAGSFNVTTLGTTYFRYYVIDNGVTVYSNQATFAPVADAVTGGTAIATVSTSAISKAVKADETSTSTFTATFAVTKAGTYASFVPAAATGNTTGLTLSTVTAGSFVLGSNAVTFSVNGVPNFSLDGNSFVVPRIGTLSTGAITGFKAICDGSAPTTVVTVTSDETGKKWMDRNLGASRAATSSADYKAYGCMYQWGRGNDGHASMSWLSSTAGSGTNGTTTSRTSVDNPSHGLFIVTGTTYSDWRSPQNNDLWQEDYGYNNPCPSGFRVPTETEMNAEVKGEVYNADAAYSNSNLKFTAPGMRQHTGVMEMVGSNTGYWTRSRDSYSGLATVRFFNATQTSNGEMGRSWGFPVRCISRN